MLPTYNGLAYFLKKLSYFYRLGRVLRTRLNRKKIFAQNSVLDLFFQSDFYRFSNESSKSKFSMSSELFWKILWWLQSFLGFQIGILDLYGITFPCCRGCDSRSQPMWKKYFRRSTKNKVQSNLVIRNVLIRNKLVLRNHFPSTIVNLFHKDKEHLALRNNFRVTKKFLITRLDCTLKTF